MCNRWMLLQQIMSCCCCCCCDPSIVTINDGRYRLRVRTACLSFNSIRNLALCQRWYTIHDVTTSYVRERCRLCTRRPWHRIPFYSIRDTVIIIIMIVIMISPVVTCAPHDVSVFLIMWRKFNCVSYHFVLQPSENMFQGFPTSVLEVW